MSTCQNPTDSGSGRQWPWFFFTRTVCVSLSDSERHSASTVLLLWPAVSLWVSDRSVADGDFLLLGFLPQWRGKLWTDIDFFSLTPSRFRFDAQWFMFIASCYLNLLNLKKFSLRWKDYVERITCLDPKINREKILCKLWFNLWLLFMTCFSYGFIVSILVE